MTQRDETNTDKWFMVFSAGRRQQPGTAYAGPSHMAPVTLVWDSAPLGVFRAPSADLACQAAARKGGHAGTFFALEGLPWGLEMTPVDGVTELGEDFGNRPALGA